MDSRGRPVTAATSYCMECVACEGDQIVSLPSRKSATAQDGPMEACVWMANS